MQEGVMAGEKISVEAITEPKYSRKSSEKNRWILPHREG
jgi:hypothetical protein